MSKHHTTQTKWISSLGAETQNRHFSKMVKINKSACAVSFSSTRSLTLQSRVHWSGVLESARIFQKKGKCMHFLHKSNTAVGQFFTHPSFLFAFLCGYKEFLSYNYGLLLWRKQPIKERSPQPKNHLSRVLWKWWKCGSERIKRMSCELCAGTKPKVQINKIFAWCNYLIASWI